MSSPVATPVAALTIIGAIVALLGLFAGGSVEFVALGLAAIAAAGLIGAVATRGA